MSDIENGRLDRHVFLDYHHKLSGPSEVQDLPGQVIDARYVLTIRDRFAIAALQGLASNPSGPWQSNSQNGFSLVNITLDQVADLAFEIADKMIAKKNGCD